MARVLPLRVGASGRYFGTADGAPFLFIGANDALTWPGLAPLFRRRDVGAVDAYLGDLAANGVTTLRLMLEYAHREHRYFEQPRAGVFNPHLVRYWDDLFGLCEAHGLRVLLAPWDNFWMARRWKRHPYNWENGGPAQGPGAFFTDEATIAATIARFEFVIRRWGDHGALGAWDLFNEIDPYWGGDPWAQAATITRISEAIRDCEQKTWGWTRPQTVSIFGPKPSPAYEELIFRHPSLDFATTHIYEGAIDYPKDPVTPALTMARWTRYGRARTLQARPFTDTEHGPIHLFNDHRKYQSEADDDLYERRLMWAHIASGGAGSGFRWPARNPHNLTAGMVRALAGLSAWSKQIDWNNFAPDVTRENAQDLGSGVTLETEREAAPPGDTHVIACRDAAQAIAFVLRNTTEPLSGRAALAVPGLARENGARYTARVWDIAKASAADSKHNLAPTGESGVLRVPLPPIAGDFEVHIRPAR